MKRDPELEREYGRYVGGFAGRKGKWCNCI